MRVTFRRVDNRARFIVSGSKTVPSHYIISKIIEEDVANVIEAVPTGTALYTGLVSRANSSATVFCAPSSYMYLSIFSLGVPIQNNHTLTKSAEELGGETFFYEFYSPVTPEPTPIQLL